MYGLTGFMSHRLFLLGGAAGSVDAGEIVQQGLNRLDARVFAVAVYKLSGKRLGYPRLGGDALPTRRPFGLESFNQGLKDVHE